MARTALTPDQARDAITAARKALFEAGGISIMQFGNKGRMVPDQAEFDARADAYNALAELHLAYPE